MGQMTNECVENNSHIVCWVRREDRKKYLRKKDQKLLFAPFPSHLPQGERITWKSFVRDQKTLTCIRFTFTLVIGWVCSPSTQQNECLVPLGNRGAGYLILASKVL